MVEGEIIIGRRLYSRRVCDDDVSTADPGVESTILVEGEAGGEWGTRGRE